MGLDGCRSPYSSTSDFEIFPPEWLRLCLFNFCCSYLWGREDRFPTTAALEDIPAATEAGLTNSVDGLEVDGKLVILCGPVVRLSVTETAGLP